MLKRVIDDIAEALGDTSLVVPSNPLGVDAQGKVVRLVSERQSLGEIVAGWLTGGTFSGPELRGTLLPGASADWQIILPDGTALGDVRYTLDAERGDVLYVQSQSVRHASAAVLELLGRGEDVDAGEYTFRGAAKIEAGADSLDWLNKGTFVGLGGRQRRGLIYELYLVG